MHSTVMKLQRELVKANERVEELEGQLAKLREQKPFGWVISQSNLLTLDTAWAEENADYCSPLFAEPVPAPAVPEIEGPMFTVADEGLDTLLNLSADLARGEGNHDIGVMWNEALESVLARLKAAPSVPKGWKEALQEAAYHLEQHAQEYNHPGQYTLIKNIRALLQSATYKDSGV